jgi:Rhodopirellula transposase DDE domain
MPEPVTKSVAQERQQQKVEPELQSQLADSFGLTLTVAHYPTGASKWNPIEHRLFSEISKNGRRAARQLSEDPPLHSLHQDSDRLIGHRPSGPSQLSHGHRADTRTTPGPSHPPTRNPAQMELHYLAQSVNLFLRRP